MRRVAGSSPASPFLSLRSRNTLWFMDMFPNSVFSFFESHKEIMSLYLFLKRRAESAPSLNYVAIEQRLLISGWMNDDSLCK